MNDPIRPIFWYQGLFLQPQHFQWQDLLHQFRLRPFQSYGHPYFWGFAKLRIQEDVLKNETFEIMECEALFQDGSWVVFPGNATLSSRSFKGVWTEMDKPFNIYIGLRKWNPAGENVTEIKVPDDPAPADARFVSRADPEEVRDFYQQAPHAQIKFLHHAVRIFWENELDGAGSYDLLPAARLEFNGNEIVPARNFAPPSLTLTASPALTETVKGIREELTLRCHVLEEYKRIGTSPATRGAPSGDETNYTIFLLALRSLSRYVPLLHHLTDDARSHPWMAYGLLRSLVGELSTFSDRIDIMGRLKDGAELMPVYRHDDAGTCFAEARVLISELLNGIMVGAENIIHLVREGDYFQGRIPPETFDNRNAFYLVLRSTAVSDDEDRNIMNMIKTSSTERLPVLIRRALPGMPLDRIAVPPPGLPRRPDSLYFKLDRSSPEWEEIQRRQDICLYWGRAPEDAGADLVIIRR